MIRLTNDPINSDELLRSVESNRAGAVVLFLGTTREYTGDRQTISLDYECYPEMAEKKLLELEAEARRRPMDLNPSAAHLAIVNPLRAGGLSGLFRTHPPTEERVRRLEEIAQRGV